MPKKPKLLKELITEEEFVDYLTKLRRHGKDDIADYLIDQKQRFYIKLKNDPKYAHHVKGRTDDEINGMAIAKAFANLDIARGKAGTEKVETEGVGAYLPPNWDRMNNERQMAWLNNRIYSLPINTEERNKLERLRKWRMMRGHGVTLHQAYLSAQPVTPNPPPVPSPVPPPKKYEPDVKLVAPHVVTVRPGKATRARVNALPKGKWRGPVVLAIKRTDPGILTTFGFSSDQITEGIVPFSTYLNIVANVEEGNYDVVVEASDMTGMYLDEVHIRIEVVADAPIPTPIPVPPTPTPVPVPPPPQDDKFTLSVNTSPKGAGRTTPRDGEIHRYDKDEKIVIQQFANPDYTFVGWRVNGVDEPGTVMGGHNVLELTMDQNYTVFAVYEGGEKIILMVDSIPFDGVRVQIQDNPGPAAVWRDFGSGPNTPAHEEVVNGTYMIQVPAEVPHPTTGRIYKFIGWEDGSKKIPTGGNIQRKITISESTTLTAKYESLKLIIDSKPIRGIPITITSAVLPAGSVTRYSLDVQESETYKVEVPEIFEAPDNKVYYFKKWIRKDGEETSREIEVLIDKEGNTIVAEYEDFGKGVEHMDRPVTGSPYRSGLSRGASQASQRATAAMGIHGIKKRLGREVKPRELFKRGRDPHLLAATNKGKRMLNKYARLEYDHIFEGFKEKWKTEQKNFKAKRAEIRKKARLVKGLQFKAFFSKSSSATKTRYRTESENLRDLRREYMDMEKKFSDDLDRRSTRLAKELEKRAENIAVIVSRRFQIPLNSEDQKSVDAELKTYSQDLAEDFATRGRTIRHAAMRAMGIGSRGAETFGAAGMNLLYSLWDLLLGPWTWTTLFVIVYFLFILSYVDFSLQFLYVMPLIAALFVFILNFSDSFRPLDWVTHFMSGAMIGYGAAILLVALGAHKWSFIGGSASLGFWIAWIVLVFLAVFQLYQTSGHRVIIQASVVIIIFGWVALGPYSAYYEQAIDQVKTPMEIAWRAGKNAVTDIWLLATDPTEWYARQQLVNVRPERPLAFPKGVEVISLEALPPSVPGGQPFLFTTVIKNEGPLLATNIFVSASCNQWCDPPPPDPDIDKRKYHLCIDTTLRNDIWCAESCDEYEDETGKPEYTLNECVVQCRDKEVSIGPFGLSNLCRTRDPEQLKQNYYAAISSMERDEAEVITIPGFTANTFTGREAELRNAKINVNISYTYSTSSQLEVSVIDTEELQRRFREGDTVFKPVVATAKTSPAKLSLNVGPQPLKAGEEAFLLISVSNDRDDSRIILPDETLIEIIMPDSIGQDLVCDGQKAEFVQKEGQDVWRLRYEVIPSRGESRVEIKPYDFNSIYAFICTFTAKNDDEINIEQSGIVTAELRSYVFVHTIEKNVPVTTPIGVLSDPFERVCNTCGGGIFDTNICGRDECHGLSEGGDKVCYFEDLPGTHPPGFEACRSFGPDPKCEQFITKYACENEKENAPGGELNCKWVGGTNLGSDVDEGHCVTIEETERVSGTGAATCTEENYNRYKDKIQEAITEHKLGQYVDEPEVLVAAVISQESQWNPNAYNENDPSYGLMQIVPKFHSECDTAKITSYDVEENIDCGVQFLASLAQEHMDDPPRTYHCKPGTAPSYSGVDAVIRYYNGWNTRCTDEDGKTIGDPYYVENVKNGFETCRDVISAAEAVPQKGDPDYCEKKLENKISDADAVACLEGEGGCKLTAECKLIGREPNPPERLECRTNVVNGIGVCCFPSDTNEQCLQKFNEWNQ